MNPSAAPQPLLPAPPQEVVSGHPNDGVRKLRLLELLLVLAVAFAIPIYQSIVIFLLDVRVDPKRMVAGDARVFSGLLEEGVGMAVLCYVLFRQGRSLRDLGWRPRIQDALIGLALGFCAVLAARIVFNGVQESLRIYGVKLPQRHPLNIPAFGFWPLAVTFMVVNAFYEEIIVRAYAMTEIAFLSRNWLLAGFVSVVVQTSYHFYQGSLSALSYVPLFGVFALYYAQTRRIAPIVIAHMLIDLNSLYQLKH